MRRTAGIFVLLLLLAAPAQASPLMSEESAAADRAGPFTIVTDVFTGTARGPTPST